MFLLQDRVLPYSNRRAQALRHVIRGGTPRTFDVINRKWLVARDGSIYNYTFYDQRRHELNGLSIYEFDPRRGDLVRRVYVGRAGFVPGSGQTWKSTNGWVREFTKGTDLKAFVTFPARDLALEAPDYFATEAEEPDRMTYGQLKRYIRDLSASGVNVVPQTVALYRKVSFPFVTLIMTLIAVPFAVTTGKRGALYGIAVGIVLAVVYWTTSSAFSAVGTAGMMPAMLAAWAPNLIFGAGAAYLLLTVRTDGSAGTEVPAYVRGRRTDLRNFVSPSSFVTRPSSLVLRPPQFSTPSARSSEIHTSPVEPGAVFTVSTTIRIASTAPRSSGVPGSASMGVSSRTATLTSRDDGDIGTDRCQRAPLPDRRSWTETRIGAALRPVKDTRSAPRKKFFGNGTAMAAYCPAGAPPPSRQVSVRAVLVGVRTVAINCVTEAGCCSTLQCSMGTGRAQCGGLQQRQAGAWRRETHTNGVPDNPGHRRCAGRTGPNALDTIDGGPRLRGVDARESPTGRSLHFDAVSQQAQLRAGRFGQQ